MLLGYLNVTEDEVSREYVETAVSLGGIEPYTEMEVPNSVVSIAVTHGDDGMAHH